MSRNVLNTWDVDSFLKAIAGPEQKSVIRDWFDRVARRWILKEFPATGQVVRILRQTGTGRAWFEIRWRDDDGGGTAVREGDLPDWLPGALPQGVDWLDMGGPHGRSLAGQLRCVLIYFRSLDGSPRFARLNRMSLPVAIAEARDFQMRQNQRRAADGNTLMSFGDGSRIALLTSSEDLKDEGARMSHCVGSYKKALRGEVDIVSLRDLHDRPHVTIEIARSRLVEQIKGRANRAVPECYRPHVLSFIENLGLRVRYDRDNVGLAFRPCEFVAPQGWPAQAGLRALIRGEVCDVLDYEDEIEAFYEGAEAAIDTMSDEDWSCFIDLFRNEDGRFVWLQPISRFEVGTAVFTTLRLIFPLSFYWAVSEGRSERCRALRCRLRDEATAVIVDFCRGDDTGLLVRRWAPALARFDFRRLRHQHQERLQRRLAAERRTLRRRAAGLAEPQRALARWEANRRAFGRLLQEGGGDYL